ncbi:UNVERIFIED_CONTAM: Exocyst complex component EXO70A1 [Sesamum angustifolium]|uniref:Exocyst subunit Exo70 family protein n=1 Tax=Sesamum angustifolium TaxID=2727405 RepID=A0AAW2RKK1_9LAMI
MCSPPIDDRRWLGLEDEFRNILLSHTTPVEADWLTESTQLEFASQEFELKEEIAESSSDKQFEHQESNSSSTSSCYKTTSSIRELDLIPSYAVYDLRCIAERMIAAGYLRECIQVYASVRKSAVDASLKKLNVEKLSIGDIQRLEWETLETKIRRWIRAAKICVRVLFASERRLCEEIFEGSRYSSDPNVPDVDLSEYEGQASTLALHLIWIIVILQFNLDGKSKHYKDASLAHLFMMNNVHYIVQKIKGSPELREMIGDDYLKKLTGKFRLAATNYQRSTWVRVLHCLRDEGLHVSGSFSSGVSKSALRERFKAFNAMFEEVHRTQATWLIPDTQLREELRISISEKLIPAYRSFLGRFRSHIESGRHPENYIKYSVEDLENAVLDFFEGYPVSQHLRRRSE